MLDSSCASTPRLSTPSSAQIEQQGEVEKIAQSESLNALFSYFKTWAPNDPSLKFRSDSVVKTHLDNLEEVA